MAHVPARAHRVACTGYPTCDMAPHPLRHCCAGLVSTEHINDDSRSAPQGSFETRIQVAGVADALLDTRLKGKQQQCA
jgi:hypothetical protein